MHWVFEESQLERALQAYTERRQQQGVSQAQGDAFHIREFLKSPEARAHKLLEDRAGG